MAVSSFVVRSSEPCVVENRNRKNRRSVFVDQIGDTLGFEESVDIVLHVRSRYLDIERFFQLVERGADLEEFIVVIRTADARRAAHCLFVQCTFRHS